MTQIIKTSDNAIIANTEKATEPKKVIIAKVKTPKVKSEKVAPIIKDKAPTVKANSKNADILAIGNDILASKTNRFGATIYQNALFAECQTDKDKKHLRIKLRRKLYAFFSDFVMKEKNKAELAKIKEAWVAYSAKVYKEAGVIMDSNATPENRELATRFLKAMK